MSFLLERDMEEIMLLSPDSFWPSGWSVVGNQVGLNEGSQRIDVLLEKKPGGNTLLVAEIERGRISLNHVAKVRVYVDELKKASNNNCEVLGCVVANEIPPDKRKLAEQYDLMWFEFPEPYYLKIVKDNRLLEKLPSYKNGDSEKQNTLFKEVYGHEKEVSFWDLFFKFILMVLGHDTAGASVQKQAANNAANPLAGIVVTIIISVITIMLTGERK